MELCRTSFTAAQIEIYLICPVKVWAHSAHHPAYKFPFQTQCLGLGLKKKKQKKKPPAPAAAQKAHIPLVRMKRHHRLFTVRDKFLSIDKLSRCPVLLEEERNQFLFEFPREILGVEKWYFAELVILRSLALKLGHFFCLYCTLIQVINRKTQLGSF